MSPLPSAENAVLAALMAMARRKRRDEAALRKLVDWAEPRLEALAADAVARRFASAGDEGDLASEALLRLIVKLRQLTEDPDSEPITRFADYVSTLFRHTLDDYRRRMNPPRAKLTHRIRYVLTHTRLFAVWGRDPLLCGLAAWAGRTDTVIPPKLEPRADLRGDDVRSLRRLVEGVFLRAGAPVQLTALVDAIGPAVGVAAEPFVSTTMLRRLALLPGSDERLQSQGSLRALWQEIEQLPVLQRRALLLNLQTADGESIARALAALGIASIRRIATSLEMPLEELLGLWNELPLPDLQIGGMIGRTRQQVINLRKSARERLSRRLKHPLGSKRA